MNDIINGMCIELFLIAGFFGGLGIALMSSSPFLGWAMVIANLGYGLLTASVFAYNFYRKSQEEQ